MAITDLNNEVNMRNDYRGVGARGGFNTVWNIGRGFAFTGNTAISIVYGRFKVKHEDYFRASRVMIDLDLGIQWSTSFGKHCHYGFMIGVA